VGSKYDNDYLNIVFSCYSDCNLLLRVMFIVYCSV